VTPSRQEVFASSCNRLGIRFEDEIRGGANYEVAAENEGQLFVSGMIPRAQGEIIVTGRVGEATSLEAARRAAEVCVLRGIAVLRQSLGSLDRVKKILRVNVYVQSAGDFTQQSEVADAASDILYAVFAPAGGHTRTSVGVYQLPKNASVEIDLLVAVHPV
jgi:enamine deaminase RidA (YjgF/YER057c/UK114 family)